MLEYALFDLSGFVQPTVVLTGSVMFAPSPLTVKSADTADQLTVNVNSGPDGDRQLGGAQLHSAGRAHHHRNERPDWRMDLYRRHFVVFAHFRSGGKQHRFGDADHRRGHVHHTLELFRHDYGDGFERDILHYPSFNENVIFQQLPPISWATPANIVYGTPLSGAQLNASSTLAGTFV